MNDFDYEVLQQKRLAHMAKHRKSGSKSKKCSLPSDYLTKKQIREMCGEMKVFKLREPMKWSSFIDMSRDLQKEYLDYISKEYGVNTHHASKMFGASYCSVMKHIKENGLDGILVNHKMSKANVERFESFCTYRTEEDDGGTESECADMIVEKNIQNEVPGINELSGGRVSSQMKMTSFTLEFNGNLDRDMIFNSMMYMIPSGTNASVKITCEINE